MSVLKSIFGPSKAEIWAQIANEIGGEVIDRGFWKTNALAFRHKEWTIILDILYKNQGKYSQAYTRIRAPFVNKDGLYFNIYPENFFGAIGKLFGMQDIEIGDNYFDAEFIIKSNSEEKIGKLLKSDKLKELITSIPNKVHFEIRDSEYGLFKKSFPDGVDMLYFETVGVIKDKETLRSLFLLFSAILERLVQIDSAYENDPLIDLK